ncbi:hypothetical protein [Paenirhodobacter populi]|uniref:O-antigen ligase domain-containing protein n=1 Tax=Paenirhodobacter populi TaxID=2306993 RepID=A0A443JBV6_9RHOB|nr:hypothetical protein [Sinirhodobacter populi]RWR18001.1 hypothetical protein D2T30_17305 [Sinirhodobacter populi]
MYALAQIVLYSWPLVTWVLFRKLRPETALIATIVLGYLFIPERVGFSLPALPAINKHTLPAFCALTAIWLLHRREAEKAAREARRAALAAGQATAGQGDGRPAPAHGRPGGRRAMARRHGSRIALIIPLAVGVLMLNSVVGWLTNRDPLYFAARIVPGLSAYDVGMLWKALLVMLLPLFIGRHYLRSREAQVEMLKVLAWSGAVYACLVLLETRISPKLNIMLYGFFAHDWMQHLRDGYRPIVFLAHGLRVGIFLAMAALAAAALARNNVGGKRWMWLAMALWITFCLAVSRNLGATMIAFGLLPVVLFFPVRLQFLLGLVIAAMVLVYPLARGSGLIPADRVVTAVYSFNPARAGSLGFRLEQEDVLLGRANLKPVSGWGGWGRQLTFDAETGKRDSIPDGSWIIIIGEKGWIGYLGIFGLLCLPVIFTALRYRRYEFGAIEGGITIVLCANLIDLIPNSSLLPLLWLMAGMMWGRLEQASVPSAEASIKQGAKRAQNERIRSPGARIHQKSGRRPPAQPGNSAPSNT